MIVVADNVGPARADRARMGRVGTAADGQVVGGVTQYFRAIQEIRAQAVTGEDSVLGSDHKVQARVVIVLIDDLFLWLADIKVVGRGVRPRDIREWKQVQIGEAGANLIGRRNHVDGRPSRPRRGIADPTEWQTGLWVINVPKPGCKLRQDGLIGEGTRRRV